MTSKLRRTLPSGFEVWKQDRARGRQVALTRADEDRLCDALRETFGDFQVINSHKTWESSAVEWRDSIAAFPITPPPGADKYSGVGRVSILFPWPKWELRAEPLYYGPWKTEAEREAAWGGYVVKSYPPLSVVLDRSKFLGTEFLDGFPWRREALIDGFIQVSWCTEGPYAEAQQAFLRKLFRLLGKLTTNRLRFLRFDEAGRIKLDEAEKGYRFWAGADALDWCRADNSRVLTEHWALGKRKAGHVAYGYRPLD